MKKFRIVSSLALLLITLAIILSSFTGCDLLDRDGGSGNAGGSSQSSQSGSQSGQSGNQSGQNNTAPSFATLNDIPPFSGEPFVVLNENKPDFKATELVTKSYETYSEFDSLGRCGVVIACIGKDLMPTDDREEIGSVTPSGWVQKKYDTELVEGGYLYNRCHLIGFQLTGENANKLNLITGTRYMNVDGMLPFENMVADYIKETNNHVLYRVTPIFDGNDLVASGVVMEAFSVEDNGEGICFNVYVYNNQPGITINYATGESALGDNIDMGGNTDTEGGDGDEDNVNKEGYYVINKSSGKFHYPTCSYAENLSSANKAEHTGERDTLIAQGYSPCGKCKP